MMKASRSNYKYILEFQVLCNISERSQSKFCLGVFWYFRRPKLMIDDHPNRFEGVLIARDPHQLLWKSTAITSRTTNTCITGLVSMQQDLDIAIFLTWWMCQHCAWTMWAYRFAQFNVSPRKFTMLGTSHYIFASSATLVSPENHQTQPQSTNQRPFDRPNERCSTTLSV